MSAKKSCDFLLELQGIEGHSEEIPLRSLHTSLTEFMHVVDALANYQHGRDTGSDPSAKEVPKSRYTLTCRAIVPGRVGISIGIQDNTLSAETSTFADSLKQLVGRTIELVNSNDLPNLERLITDFDCVTGILRAFWKINRLQKSVHVSIVDAYGKTIYDGAQKHSITLPTIATRQEVSDTIFNGQLISIDRSSGTLKLKLLNGESLELQISNFSDSAINLTQWDRIVQVRETARKVGRKAKIKITNLQSLTYVDDSPIVLDRITLNENNYTVNPPLEFTVTFDVEDQVYVLDGEYDIYLAEFTREHLRIAIQELLETDWMHLVQEEDTSRLTMEAMNRVRVYNSASKKSKAMRKVPTVRKYESALRAKDLAKINTHHRVFGSPPL